VIQPTESAKAVTGTASRKVKSRNVIKFGKFPDAVRIFPSIIKVMVIP
jgi:hypothetical protein